MAKKKKAKARKKQTKRRATVKRRSPITAEKIKKALRDGAKVYLEVRFKTGELSRLRELTADEGSRYTSSVERYYAEEKRFPGEGSRILTRSCWQPSYISGNVSWVDNMFDYDKRCQLKISKALVIKTKTVVTKKAL